MRLATTRFIRPLADSQCRLLLASACVASVVLAAQATLHAEPIKSQRVLTEQERLGQTGEQQEIAEAQYPEVGEALQVLQSGDEETALKLLAEAVEKYPELPPPRVLLARIFSSAASTQPAARAQQMAAVRSQLELQFREDPNYPEIYLMLGELDFSEGRLIEAEQLFKKGGGLIRSFEGNEDTERNFRIRYFAGIAAINQQRGLWDDALKYLDAWKDIDEENANVYSRMAQTFLPLERYDDAEQAYAKAHELNDTLHHPAVNMAVAFERAGKSDESKTWMQKALEAEPDNLQVRLNVARLMFETSQFADAFEQAETAAQLAPDSLDAKILCGVIARHLNDYEAAKEHLESASLMSPGSFPVSNQLALVYIENGSDSDRQKALELAEANYQRFANAGTSDTATSASTLGWVYYNLDRLDEATQALQRARQAARGRMTGDTAYYLACLENRHGNVEAVRGLLEYAQQAQGPFVYRDPINAMIAELPEPTEEPTEAESPAAATP